MGILDSMLAHIKDPKDYADWYLRKKYNKATL
jgi:hypothetical protein